MTRSPIVDKYWTIKDKVLWTWDAEFGIWTISGPGSAAVELLQVAGPKVRTTRAELLDPSRPIKQVGSRVEHQQGSRKRKGDVLALFEGVALKHKRPRTPEVADTEGDSSDTVCSP